MFKRCLSSKTVQRLVTVILGALVLMVALFVNSDVQKAEAATMRFSRRFSSLRVRSRRASLTSMPPYLRFQRSNVSTSTPRRRPNSFVGRRPRCVLLADSDDLLLLEPALSHRSSLRYF